MVIEVEVSRFDLRFESYRLRNNEREKRLLSSICDKGIQDALEGVDSSESHLLLNGFKRLRCAKRLGIEIVPYRTLGVDEAMGIVKFIRLSNNRSLTILEQAALIDELKTVYGMTVPEISQQFERSKAWVSVRIGVIGQMSKAVREKVFTGKFPAYSYLYTLRQFMRINSVKNSDIDEFVHLMSGKNLSLRDIEQLAYGYFKGSEEFREQLKKNIIWGLEQLKNVPQDPDSCSEFERKMLNELEILPKYMQRIMQKSDDTRFVSSSFHAQANLLAAGILSKINPFSIALRKFYDRTGEA